MSNTDEMVLDLDTISDSDFDFLCDTALDIVYDTLPLAEADELTLNKISERLNSEKYDINIELDIPHEAWWQEDELPELLGENVEEGQGPCEAKSEDEGEAEDEACAPNALDNTIATLELNAISITSTGSHAGERVVVASLHVDVPANLQNIEQAGLKNLKIKWLPELDN